MKVDGPGIPRNCSKTLRLIDDSDKLETKGAVYLQRKFWWSSCRHTLSVSILFGKPTRIMGTINCTLFWYWRVVPKYPLLLFFVKWIISRSKPYWTPHSIRVSLLLNSFIKLRSFLLPVRKCTTRCTTTATNRFSDCLKQYILIAQGIKLDTFGQWFKLRASLICDECFNFLYNFFFAWGVS